MEGVLPMLALFIMSMVMAVQSLPLSQALSDAVGDSTEEIERVVDTRSYADFYFYNYVPLKTEYSANNASYELGRQAGGFDWNNNWINGNSFTAIYFEMIDKAEEYLNNELEGSEQFCEIPDINYELTPFADPDADDLAIRVFSADEGEDSPVRTRCISPSGEVKYVSEDSTFGTTAYAYNNRYMGLAYETVEAFLGIKDELNDLSGTVYEGSASSCSSSREEVEARAERDARDGLEGAVEGAISRGTSDRPGGAYIDILTRPENNYYVGEAGWKHIGGDVRREGNTDSSRICCNRVNGTCTNSGWEAEADGTPDFVNIDRLAEDSEYKVIVDERYETLQFDVSGPHAYQHDW